MTSNPDGSANIDSVYYRDGASNSLAMKALKTARKAMFDLFMRELRPNEASRIVDIGVSDDENEGANFLEKSYPWPRNITCAGIGTGEAIVRAYPDVTFTQIIPGQPLPFPDQSFDIACSNAVIEHVGSRAQRTAFIAEHLRVARSVFITFPNRWFPVEHHTGLPLMHYSPWLFRKALKGTRYDYWVNPQNMDFLDRTQILKDWPADKPRPTHVVTTGLNVGPFSSNVAVICK